MSFLYNILPEYTKTSDTITDINVTGQVKILEEFLNSIDSEIFDVISDSIRDILTFKDINKIKNEYLPYFSYILGYEWSNLLSVDLQKDILRNILDIYKRKGTKFSFHFGLYKLDPSVIIYEPYRDIFTLNKSSLNYGFDVYKRWDFKSINNGKCVIDSFNNIYTISGINIIKFNANGVKLWDIDTDKTNITDIKTYVLNGIDYIYYLAKDDVMKSTSIVCIDTDGNKILEYKMYYEVLDADNILVEIDCIFNNSNEFNSIYFNTFVTSNIDFDIENIAIRCFDITSDDNMYIALNLGTTYSYILNVDLNTNKKVIMKQDGISVLSDLYGIYNILDYNQSIITDIKYNNSMLYLTMSGNKQILGKSNTIFKKISYDSTTSKYSETFNNVYQYSETDYITGLVYDSNNNIYIVYNNKILIKIDDLNNINMLKDDINIYSINISKYDLNEYILIGSDLNLKFFNTSMCELFSFKTFDNILNIYTKFSKNIIMLTYDDSVSKLYFNILNGDYLTSKDYYSNGIIVVKTNVMSNDIKEVINMVIPAGWKLIIEGSSSLYYSFHDKTAEEKDSTGKFNYIDNYRKIYVDNYIDNNILDEIELQTDAYKRVYYSGIQYHSRGHSNIVMLGKTFIANSNDSIYRLNDINIFAESDDNDYTAFRNPLQYNSNYDYNVYETSDTIYDGMEFVLIIPNDIVTIETTVVGSGSGSSSLIELTSDSLNKYQISTGGGAGEIIKQIINTSVNDESSNILPGYIIHAVAGYGGIVDNNGSDSYIEILHPQTGEIITTITAKAGKKPSTFDSTNILYNGGFDYNDLKNGAGMYSTPNNWSNNDKLIKVYDSYNDNIIYFNNFIDNNYTVHRCCTAGESSYDLGLGYKTTFNRYGSGGCYEVSTINEEMEYIYGKGGNGYIKIILHKFNND